MSKIQFMLVCLVSVLAMNLFLSGATARADDLVDNPQYQTWAKYKPGTMVKYTHSTDAMGQKNEGEMTQTLKSVTPEKVVIEVKMSMTVQGMKNDMPAQTVEYQAKVAKDAVQTPGQPKGMKPADVKNGKETVQVGGKSYDCTWTEFATEQNGMKMLGKSWLSDEVPGKLVKMESSTSGAMESKTTMELAAMEVK